MPADYLLSCKICRYRRMVLPVEIEGEDEQDCHFHSEFFIGIGKEIEVARHSRPSKFWKQVLDTLHLTASIIKKDEIGRSWSCFPLRGFNNIQDEGRRQTRATSVQDSDGHVIPLNINERGTWSMWHMTHCSHLVESSEYSPGSTGIFIDDCMKYGECTHKGKSGVNVYAYPPFLWLVPGDGWCCLRLECMPYFSHLKGGAKGRYCICGLPGLPCTVVRPVELLIMHCDIPDFMRL